ncbi:MAG: vWA domain-containing protein, partial [Chloroflexota bacterium]
SDRRSTAENGQSAVILAIMFLTLLAFVGLATDAGILYMSYGQLRRAADAAALSAASQLREARPLNQITEAATQYVRLQNIPVGAGDVVVETCSDSVEEIGVIPDSKTHEKVLADPSICTYPVRKLVRVTVTTRVQPAFMQLFGWRDPIPLTTYAVSEAASLEVMLVIDTSFSMVYDSSITNGIDDDKDGCVDEVAGAAGCDGNDDNWLRKIVDSVPPSGDGDPVDNTPVCNTVAAGASGLSIGTQLPTFYIPTEVGITASPIHSCRPFEWVRDAAAQFVSTYVKFPYDRVGIVTFAQISSDPHNSGMGLRQSVGSPQATSVTDTVNMLSSLDVSVPPYCEDPDTDGDPDNDWTSTATGALGKCYSTNTGDGLKIAIEDLNTYSRQNALRFIIFLSDGAATGSPPDAYNDLYYACPNNLTDPDFDAKPCSDGDAREASRHADNDFRYDADDYARDQADEIAGPGKPPTIIFTIGLGAEVTENPTDGSWNCPSGQTLCNPDGLPNGEQLLRYIADVGDGDRDGDNNVIDLPGACGRDSDGVYQTGVGDSCGNYFYAQGGLDLASIFTEIAQEIFTRITE